MTKPVEIFQAPHERRIFLHEPSGELFQYHKRGGAPNSVEYYGPGDARAKDGTRLKSVSDKSETPKAGKEPEAAPVEMTEDERAIRNDLKAMLGNTDLEPGEYLSGIVKAANQLRNEWKAYQTAERAKMVVPVDGFLVPESEGD